MDIKIFLVSMDRSLVSEILDTSLESKILTMIVGTRLGEVI